MTLDEFLMTQDCVSAKSHIITKQRTLIEFCADCNAADTFDNDQAYSYLIHLLEN